MMSDIVKKPKKDKKRKADADVVVETVEEGKKTKKNKNAKIESVAAPRVVEADAPSADNDLAPENQLQENHFPVTEKRKKKKELELSRQI